jgi:hypothetical protein
MSSAGASDVSSNSDIDYDLPMFDPRHDEVAARNAARQEARARNAAGAESFNNSMETLAQVARERPLPRPAGGPGTLNFLASHEGDTIFGPQISTKFTVVFAANGDMLDVRWTSRDPGRALLNARFVDIVAVAFYPLPESGTYVMSLWRRDALRPIDHPLLIDRDSVDFGHVVRRTHPAVSEEPHRPGTNTTFHTALRFSQAEVNRNVDNDGHSLWAARLGWNVDRHAGCYLVARAVQPTAPAPAAAGAAADDHDISALLAAATLTDTERLHLNEWTCGICLDGIEAGPQGRELVAAHPAYEDASGRHVLHVFHRHCLERWRANNSHCSQLCPPCKRPLHTRPLPAVWSAGNTTLRAHMGVNPYMVCGFNTTCKKMCDI